MGIPRSRTMNNTGTRVWAIKAGDSLPLIAAELYGDPKLWRLIAEANEIDDPLRFPTSQDVGRVILVP